MNKLVVFGVMLVGIGSADKDTIVLTTGESMEGHNLGCNFPSADFYEEVSIYWMRERFRLSRRVCIKILEHSLSLRGPGRGDHLRWKN